MRALLALFLAVVAWPAAAQGTAPRPLQVRFETTLGTFTVALDTERAPLSAANIARYAADGHYDGTIFHRVVPGFAVQGGGFTADGTEKSARDPVPNESGNGLTNRRGTVALARGPDPHSAAAEFYVNLADNINLDPRPDRWAFAVVGYAGPATALLQTYWQVGLVKKGTFEGRDNDSIGIAVNSSWISRTLIAAQN